MEKNFVWDVHLVAFSDYSWKQKKEKPFTLCSLPSLDECIITDTWGLDFRDHLIQPLYQWNCGLGSGLSTATELKKPGDRSLYVPSRILNTLV